MAQHFLFYVVKKNNNKKTTVGIAADTRKGFIREEGRKDEIQLFTPFQLV